MKKLIITFVTLTLFLSTEIVFAQTTPASGDVVLLNVNRYATYFGFTGGRIDYGSNYVLSAPRAERREFSALGGNETVVDTPLEFALLSYYSPAVIQIRPVEADNVLPADNPRLAGLRLGAATYKELLILRFLTPNDTAAISRYENMIRFIQDRSGVTRAGIETYFRDGIRGFVNEIVNEEFNSISFLLNNATTNPVRDHNSILIRNPQNGHYRLNYGGAYTNNETREINAPTLNALLAEMVRRTSDFDQTGISQVRAQAALIPAVVYADWKARGVAGGVDAMALVTETLTNFYLSPSQTSYNNLLGIFARYTQLVFRERDVFARIAVDSLEKTIDALNSDLMSRLTRDISTGNVVALMRIPNDPRFNVFSTRYTQ